MIYDVFISYSQKDLQTAMIVCSGLEDRNLKCWIAPRDILPGKGWGGSIIEAIDNSKVLVLIYSSKSNESQHVVRELARAAKNKIPVIPFIIEKTLQSKDVAYFLSSSQWLDATQPLLEDHVKVLASILFKILGEKQENQNDFDQKNPGLERFVEYTPELLERWEKKLLDGVWNEVLDCRDEIMLHDLRRLVEDILASKNYTESCCEDVGVALIELCRNVASHASDPIGVVDISINYKYKSLFLTVTSSGNPFTLESALSKHRKSDREKESIHGIENLLTRGEIQILLTNPGKNRVRFIYKLVEKAARKDPGVELSLTRDSIILGSKHYSRDVWLNSLGIKTAIEPFTNNPDPGNILERIKENPHQIEKIKQLIINESDDGLPVKVNLSDHTGKWTKTINEVLVESTFHIIIESIKVDNRFILKELDNASEIRQDKTDGIMKSIISKIFDRAKEHD